MVLLDSKTLNGFPYETKTLYNTHYTKGSRMVSLYIKGYFSFKSPSRTYNSLLTFTIFTCGAFLEFLLTKVFKINIKDIFEKTLMHYNLRLMSSKF